MSPDLVTAARGYLGVPFRHRGRTARGLDCAGLVWLCYRDLGVTLPDVRHYGREPHKDGLMEGAAAALGAPVWLGGWIDRSMLQAGDVVITRFTVEPHHVGIIGDDPIHGLSLIHCYGNIGRVVEHGLDALWQSRIVAVFRRPV